MKKSGLVLTISGDTVDEIRDKLVILAKQFGAVEATAPAAPRATRGGKKDKEEAPAANGNGAHLNGNGHAPAVEEDMFATEAPTAPAPTQNAVKVSREDVQRAIVAVQTAKGLPTARKVLNDFGAKRFAEVQEKDFAGMIQACAVALK